MIANALLQSNLQLLSAIAARFGLARLKSEWEFLRAGTEANNFPKEMSRLRRVIPTVERCISHMEEDLRFPSR
jgi:hypothetical protein